MMRADHLACAGNPLVKTPNLDRLASQGVLFTRSYCSNPICMPARASMFTGLMPRDHGVRVNGHVLRSDLPTLPGVLSTAGYHTHAAGKLHLSPWVPMVEPPDPAAYPECLQYWRDGIVERFPLPYFGFQTVDLVGGHGDYVYGHYIQWLREQGGSPEMLARTNPLERPGGAGDCCKMSVPPEWHYNRYISDSTIRVIQEASGKGQPFFAWCSYPDPHPPIAPPAPYYDMYRPDDIALPPRDEEEVGKLPPYYAQVLAGKSRPTGNSNVGISDADWREMTALTYGMVSHIDDEVGRVMDALRRLGLTDSTLVVFLGDHGNMLGAHGLIFKGAYTFRECINIPTIVASPGAMAGVVSDALVSQIDLLPSVLDFCKVPMPGSDWANKETRFERGSLMPLDPYPGRSWMDLLEGASSAVRDTVVIEDDDVETGYRVRCLVTQRYRLAIYPGTPYGELFDLENDPRELHNLWDCPEMKPLKSELVGRLLDAYSLSTPFHPIPPWNS